MIDQKQITMPTFSLEIDSPFNPEIYDENNYDLWFLEVWYNYTPEEKEFWSWSSCSGTPAEPPHIEVVEIRHEETGELVNQQTLPYSFIEKVVAACFADYKKNQDTYNEPY